MVLQLLAVFTNMRQAPSDYLFSNIVHKLN